MHAFAANVRRLLGAMVRQGRELRLQQTASSLTLLTLLAVVPMVALGLLVLTALPAFESMRGDLQRYLETHLFLPSFSDAVVRSINRFVGAADRLSTIGTAAFFATGLGAMLIRENACITLSPMCAGLRMLSSVSVIDMGRS